MSVPSHLKPCSFASLGKCCLETYTKEKKVRVVSGEDIKLLLLRSKLAPADIYDVCSHHEKVYLHKYSALREGPAMPLLSTKNQEKRRHERSLPS